MITSKRIAEILTCLLDKRGISKVSIGLDGDVVAEVGNKLSPSLPHKLTIQPTEDGNGLRIHVYLSIASINDYPDFEVLPNFSVRAVEGHLAIDSSNGKDFKVSFMIDRVDENDEAQNSLVQHLNAIAVGLWRFEELIRRMRSLSRSTVYVEKQTCHSLSWNQSTQQASGKQAESYGEHS